jgi:alpha-tubulin suppressor-like RCC1 family protein
MNDMGQLGNGTTIDSTVPKQVTTLGTIVAAVFAAGSRTCARLNTGGLWCWGENGLKELGLGDTTNRTSPVKVTALGTTVSSVAMGGYHMCVLKSDNKVFCVGRNQYGAIGNGTVTDPDFPVEVTALGTTARAIAAGSYDTSCALVADGTISCWGNGFAGGTGRVYQAHVNVLPQRIGDCGDGICQSSELQYGSCTTDCNCTPQTCGAQTTGTKEDGCGTLLECGS